MVFHEHLVQAAQTLAFRSALAKRLTYIPPTATTLNSDARIDCSRNPTFRLWSDTSAIPVWARKTVMQKKTSTGPSHIRARAYCRIGT